MNYLAELRKYVGHRPLLMAGATVFVFDEKDRLLLLKRGDNKCWGPPGVAVEPGEAVEESAKRETLEETGLELGKLSLYGVFSVADQFYRYPNGDEVHNVTIVYIARVQGGEVRISAEHTDWGYFLPAEIPSEISPPIIPILKQLLTDFQNKQAVLPAQDITSPPPGTDHGECDNNGGNDHGGNENERHQPAF